MFRRKKKAITLGNKVQAKLDGEPLRKDSQLLFQRCTTAEYCIFDDISEIFQYELCGVPSSIFETTGIPREPQKSTLAEYMWNLIELIPKAPTETYFVFDGGSLIHRLPWTKGATVDTICMTNVNYFNNHYKGAAVVFDGYPSVPTTKDATHISRTKGIISPKVNFNNDTQIKTKKDEFLSNSENKQLFINTLGEKLKDGHVQVIHAEDDADLKIVLTAIEKSEQHTTTISQSFCQESSIESIHKVGEQIFVALYGGLQQVIHAEDDADLKIVLTAIEKSEQHTTTVNGEDTDLLILLCYHSQDTINKIYFKSEPKQNTHKIKIWDITETRRKLGPLVCNILLLIHAFSGCDTTSRIFGQGKGTIFKKISTNIKLQDHAAVFCQESSIESIHKVGEQIFVALYGGLQQVIHAEDDADLKIVLTAIEKSEQHTTTVNGEDTDLLILLCYHSEDTIKKIYFKSEPKQNTHKIKIWDITETRRKLGPGNS
ncbi:unnamed protein product [Mytilus coruscus]|uniref:Uncharacterized protein n=1 Tax=Mytilus coruscus TaxID=42192 RepID=A0A6J8B282_MYTCO|nr:unnamed protein product [Mytilus coruscus]